MRTIKLYYQQTAEMKDHQSDATTFGQLKDELGTQFENKKVTVRDTRVNLEADDALLPQGDTVLFIYTETSKAGSLDKYTVTKVKNMLGNNLRRSVRRLNDKGQTNIDTSLSTEEQREALIGAIKGTPVTKKSVTKKPVKKAEKPVAKKEKKKVVKEPVKKAPLKKPVAEATPDADVYTLKINTGDKAAMQEMKDKLGKLETGIDSLQTSVSSLQTHIVSFGENLGSTIKDAVLEAFNAQEVNDELETLKREANLLKEQLRL